MEYNEAKGKVKKGNDARTKPLELSQRQAGSLLALCIEDRDGEQLRSLLEAGADPNSVWRYTSLGAEELCALSAAARWGSAEMIEALLEAGADPTGQKSLSWAKSLRVKEAIENNGPLVSYCDQQEEELEGAERAEAGFKQARKVELLIAAGVGKEAVKDAWEVLVDMINAESTVAHPLVFRALAAGGADIEATDEDGESALWRAAYEEDEGLVIELLALGADPERESSAAGGERETPLECAQRLSNKKITAIFQARMSQRALEAQVPAGRKDAKPSL